MISKSKIYTITDDINNIFKGYKILNPHKVLSKRAINNFNKILNQKVKYCKMGEDNRIYFEFVNREIKFSGINIPKRVLRYYLKEVNYFGLSDKLFSLK